MTFTHAATKSETNFSCASVHAYTSVRARSWAFDPKMRSTRVPVHFTSYPAFFAACSTPAQPARTIRPASETFFPPLAVLLNSAAHKRQRGLLPVVETILFGYLGYH